MWPFAKKEEEKSEEKPVEQEGEVCSVCGQQGADKRFVGQWFHKKCLRKMRKQAKGYM